MTQTFYKDYPYFTLYVYTIFFSFIRARKEKASTNMKNLQTSKLCCFFRNAILKIKIEL